jgi:Tfp pilus tip-associated adhesin PilY1
MEVQSATINANEATSSSIDLGDSSLVAIEMPEAWTGTVLNIQCKAEESANESASTLDWDDVYDSAGNQIAITVAQNRVVVPTAAHAAALAPLRFIRFVSTPAQNPSKTLRIITK